MKVGCAGENFSNAMAKNIAAKLSKLFSQADGFRASANA
jgi:hypothetical protein